MSKAVMISIQPKWCELIATGKKTIEVRKTKPKLDTPFKCYIYCSQNQFMARKTNGEFWFAKRDTLIQPNNSVQLSGTVIGEFICDKIEEFHEWQLNPQGKFQEVEQENLDLFLKRSCLSYKEVCTYRKNLLYYKPLYCLHISQLKIYDEPKELIEFKKMFGCYDDEMHCYDYCSIYKLGICDGRCSRLKRPFQSWGYVEELEVHNAE